MTAGKTARQTYDSISFERRLLVIYEETFYFLIYLDASSYGAVRRFRESNLSSRINTTVLDY